MKRFLLTLFALISLAGLVYAADYSASTITIDEVSNGTEWVQIAGSELQLEDPRNGVLVYTIGDGSTSWSGTVTIQYRDLGSDNSYGSAKNCTSSNCTHTSDDMDRILDPTFDRQYRLWCTSYTSGDIYLELR